MNSATNNSSALVLNFAAVMDANGNNYTGVEGDFFTWEYHVKCSGNITSITTENMMVVDIPETMTGIWAKTVHVFVIRAIYSSTTTNKFIFYVNYAYSYGA